MCLPGGTVVSSRALPMRWTSELQLPVSSQDLRREEMMVLCVSMFSWTVTGISSKSKYFAYDLLIVVYYFNSLNHNCNGMNGENAPLLQLGNVHTFFKDKQIIVINKIIL